MAPDFRTLVDALAANQVRYVIVGGVALVLQGSGRTTRDLDICYARDTENLAALAAALSPFRPTLRGAPADLPFRLDSPTLRSGLNFTLQSEAGDIDLLGELTGVGRYEDLAPGADVMELYGHPVRVMSLDALERAKRAVGRLKDLADLAEILEIRRRSGSP
jgi:hypothetical protein